MTCWETIQSYGLRSLGYGERLLPRSDFTLCDQFTLIGSGMIWNIYYGFFALVSGFLLATALAVASALPVGASSTERPPPALGCANRPNGLSSCSAARPCSSSSSLAISCSLA